MTKNFIEATIEFENGFSYYCKFDMAQIDRAEKFINLELLDNTRVFRYDNEDCDYDFVTTAKKATLKIKESLKQNFSSENPFGPMEITGSIKQITEKKIGNTTYCSTKVLKEIILAN